MHSVVQAQTITSIKLLPAVPGRHERARAERGCPAAGWGRGQLGEILGGDSPLLMDAQESHAGNVEALMRGGRRGQPGEHPGRKLPAALGRPGRTRGERGVLALAGAVANQAMLSIKS